VDVHFDKGVKPSSGFCELKVECPPVQEAAPDQDVNPNP